MNALKRNFFFPSLIFVSCHKLQQKSSPGFGNKGILGCRTSCDSYHQQCKITGCHVIPGWCCSQEEMDFTFGSAMGGAWLCDTESWNHPTPSPWWYQGVEREALGEDFTALSAPPKEFLPRPSARIINKSKSLQELAVRRCCRQSLWCSLDAAGQLGVQSMARTGVRLWLCVPASHPSPSGTLPGLGSLWGHSLQPLQLGLHCSQEH